MQELIYKETYSAMASIDLGGSRTKTRARLVTHTIGRVAAWQ